MVELKEKKEEQEKSLLGFAKMNKNQLADKARKLQTTVSQNHTKGHLIKIISEGLMQQTTPKDSDFLGFGKHGAKTYQEILQVDHEYRRWIEQVEDQQSHWKLYRFSSWLKMQSVYQELNLVNDPGAYDETHQTTRGGEALRRTASIERT